MKTQALKTYVWEWQEGGFNTCKASSFKEASAMAREMGAKVPARLNPVNCRIAKSGEVRRIQSRYAGMFD